MKFILTPEEHSALADPIKTEYTEKDGVFTLTIEGHEGALVPIEKKQIAEQHLRVAEAKVIEVEKREVKLLTDIEAAKGDKQTIEDLRTAHTTEVERLKTEHQKENDAAKLVAHTAMIDSEATTFANDRFTVPSAAKRLFQDRLVVEVVNGVDVIRTLDADGKASPKSVTELKEEFLANPEFKPIIKASQAKGGGATPANDGKGGGGAPTKVDLTKATGKELVEHIKAKQGQA